MIRALIASACVAGATCAGLTACASPTSRSLAVEQSASYPEGPLFWNGALYVAEMGADTVYIHDDLGKRPFFASPGCGPTASAPYGDGLVILCHLAGAVVAVDAQGEERARWRSTMNRQRLRNPNDAAADGRGGVYFTDPGAFRRDAPAEGRVHYLDHAGQIRTVATDLWYPNGVWVDARTQSLFLSEHLAGKVWRYRLAAVGALGARTLVRDVEPFIDRQAYREAGPDGLEVGPDGRLYVALYGAGRVIALSPTDASDTRVSIIGVAMPFVTNLAFAPSGAAVVVGALVNDTPPFAGRVVSMELQRR